MAMRCTSATTEAAPFRAKVHASAARMRRRAMGDTEGRDMTFRIPRRRGDGAGGGAGAKCAADALETYLIESEKGLNNRPTYPTSPSIAASNSVWETYGDT